MTGTIVSAMPIVYVLFVVVVLVLSPSEAYAWGPGMHIEMALLALSKIAIAAPAIREVVQKFPDAFIYGSTSPDIVVGKKYAGYFYHCHNWRLGRLILKEADSERQRAAAYGYLVHLAADIVAHNYFIPVKIVRSYGTRLLTHTYWEMRFDLGVSDEAWSRLKMITKIEIDEFDALLDRVLKKTLFPFSTNKSIFNTILILQKMRGLRGSLRLYARHSRFDIGVENREHYVDLTAEAILDFLRHPADADCMNVDPVGLAKLDYAKRVRNQIRHAIRRGELGKKEAQNFLELVRERLALGLYRPDLPGIFLVS